jgi:tetratricopeptide (TPR) repeat protein
MKSKPEKNIKSKNSDSTSTPIWLKYSYLIFVAVGFVLYFQTIKYGYTNLDDKTLIADDKDFISHLSSIPKAFQQNVFKEQTATFYRPLLVVSFIIDGVIGKMSLSMFHFTNILLHVLAVCLLFNLLVKLKTKENTAFLLSLVFLVHPSLTQAVAWVPGRNDSLLAVFVLASFLMLFRYFEQKKAVYFVLHSLFFLLALLTKETSIVLPVLLLMSLSLMYKEKLFSKKEIILGCVWVVSILIWYALRSNAIKLSAAAAPTQFLDNIEGNIPALLLYTGKLLLPFNLSVMPTMPDSTWLYGLFAIVFIVLAFVFTKTKMTGAIVFGTIWFILFLLPILLIPKEFAFYYEHRLYLPIIGVLIVFGQLQLKNRNAEKVFNGIIVGVAILFSGITFVHSNYFADKFKFWEQALATSPDSPYVNKILASIYYQEKMPEKAEELYLNALKLNPSESAVRNDLGVIYMEKNEYEKAKPLFEEELKMNPELNADKVNYNLGRINYQLKQYPEAEKYWLRTVELNPGYAETYQCMAILNADIKNNDKAREYAHKAEEHGIPVPEDFWKVVGK